MEKAPREDVRLYFLQPYQRELGGARVSYAPKFFYHVPADLADELVAQGIAKTEAQLEELARAAEEAQREEAAASLADSET